jgi:hypothetical protein
MDVKPGTGKLQARFEIRQSPLAWQVALSQDGDMVGDMSCDYVGQRIHSHGIPAGDSSPHPGFSGQIFEKRQGSSAYIPKLPGTISQRTLVCLSGVRGDSLIEAG